MEIEDLVEKKLKLLKIPYKRNVKFLWNTNILEIDFLCPKLIIEVKTSFDENSKEHTNQIVRFDEIVPKDFEIIIFTFKGNNKNINFRNRNINVFNNLNFLSQIEFNYDIYFCNHHTILEFIIKGSINPDINYFTSEKNYEIVQILINNQCQSVDWISPKINFKKKTVIYYNTSKTSFYRYKRKDIMKNIESYSHLFYFFHYYYPNTKIGYFTKPRNHNPKYTYICCNQILWKKIKCNHNKKKKNDLKLISII